MEEEIFLYYVVKNKEEQFSIWPEHKPIPAGWEEVTQPQNKDEALSYIAKMWVDMRPLSLRKLMDGNFQSDF